MSIKRTTSDIIGSGNWSLWTNDDGTAAHETIQTACALESLKLLKRMTVALEQLAGNARALGLDGLHQVVQEMARKANAARTRRANAAKKARAAKRAKARAAKLTDSGRRALAQAAH